MPVRWCRVSMARCLLEEVCFFSFNRVIGEHRVTCLGKQYHHVDLKHEFGWVIARVCLVRLAVSKTEGTRGVRNCKGLQGSVWQIG